MNVLVGMETSGRTRDAFTRAGHMAMSCDLLPTDAPGWHYQGDVLNVLHWGWDLAIFHPTCTFLCGSGLHWNSNPKSPRFGGQQTEDALAFVSFLMNYKQIPRKAFENPVGAISTRIRKPDQIIQPYQFGDNASKKNMSVAGQSAATGDQSCPANRRPHRRMAARERQVCGALGEPNRQRAKSFATFGRSLETSF